MALEQNPHAAPFLAETPEEEVEDQTPEPFTAEKLAEVLAEQSRLSDERLARILAGTQARGQPLQEEIKAPGFTLDGLPDPTHDLQGFYKGLNERLGARDQALANQVLERTQQTVNAATSAQALMSRAETMIKEAAPEFDDDVLEFAARKVADGYRSRGIDPMEALRGDLTGVAQEVLTYMDERFGQSEPEPLTRKGGRTQGIVPAGGRLPRAQAKPEKESNLVTEIRDWQTEHRLY